MIGKFPDFSFVWLSFKLEVPQKILSVLFVQLNSSENLVPLALAIPRQVEVGLSCGLLSLAGKAQSTGVFVAQKRSWPVLSKWDLKKAFDFARGKLF